MTPTAMTAAAGPDPEEWRARRHAVLRFAFGLTGAFVLAEALQWLPSFLPPLLVATLLANLPGGPPLRLGIGLVAAMAVAAIVVLAATAALIDFPDLLVGVIGLLLFFCLYSIAQGRKRLPAVLFLLSLIILPVVAVDSLAAASLMAFALVRAMVVAVLTVWLVHLLWPAVMPPRRAAAVPAGSGSAAARPPPALVALVGTLVLLPLILFFLMFDLSSALPVLAVALMVVIQPDEGHRQQEVSVRFVGTLAGGMAALALYMVVAILPSLTVLALATLLAALWFGGQVASGGGAGAIGLMACNTMVILLSSGLLTGEGTVDAWWQRLIFTLLGAAFAVGMLSLFRLSRSPAPARS